MTNSSTLTGGQENGIKIKVIYQLCDQQVLYSR